MIHHETLKLSKSIVAFIILSFMQPFIFANIESADMLYFVCLIISIFLVLCVMLREFVFDIKIVLYALFWLSILLVSYLRGDIWNSTKACIPCLAIGVFVYIQMRTNAGIFIEVFWKILSIYIILNFAIYIFFPNGLNDYAPSFIKSGEDYRLNFLGLDNSFISWFALTAMFGQLNYLASPTKRKKYYLAFIYILMTIHMFIVFSATGLVCWLLLLMLTVIAYNNTQVLFPSFRWAWIISLACFFGINIFRLQDRFSFIIENWLGKTITFSGRTVLWDLAIGRIKESPWIGYGTNIGNLLIAPNGQAYSAHNTIFETILIGGFISYIWFMAMNISIFLDKKVQKTGKAGKMIAISLTSLLFASNFEMFTYDKAIYIMLVASWCASFLVEQNSVAGNNR